MSAIYAYLSRNITIANNTIHFPSYNQEFYYYKLYGVRLENSYNIAIVGNKISGSIQAGVGTTHSSDLLIEQNIISNQETVNKYTSAGIAIGFFDNILQESSENVVVTRNTIAGSYVCGIFIVGSDNATISWNHCSDEWYGIRLQKSDYVTVSDNQCNLTPFGITLETCTNGEITGNILSRYVGIMYLGSYFTSDTDGSRNVFIDNFLKEFAGPLNAWGYLFFILLAVIGIGIIVLVRHYRDQVKATNANSQWILKTGILVAELSMMTSLPLFMNFSLNNVGKSSGVAGFFYTSGFPSLIPAAWPQSSNIFILSGVSGNWMCLSVYLITLAIPLLAFLFENYTKKLIRRQTAGDRLKSLPDWQVNTLASKLVWRSYGGFYINILGHIPMIFVSLLLVPSSGNWYIPSYVIFVLPLWLLYFWVGQKGSRGVQAAVWASAGRDKSRTGLEVSKKAGLTPSSEVSGASPQINNTNIRRQYEYVGGTVRVKAKITNPTSAGLLRVKFSLDIPESFRLLRVEPTEYTHEGPTIKLNDILPGDEKAVAWILEPLICGKEKVHGSVTGTDAQGTPFAISMDPLELEVRCPLFVQPEDASLPAVQRIFGELPVKSERVYFLPKALPPVEAFNATKVVISTRDVRFVGTFAASEGGTFDQTAWFYGATKVGDKRYVLTASVSEKDRAIRIFSACDDEAGCTGFLAEAGAAVRQALVQRGAASSEDTVRELYCEKCGGTLPRGPDAGRDVKCPECGRIWTAADFEK